MRKLLCCALACWWGLALYAADEVEALPDAPPRMANGRILDGTVSQAVPEGLIMQTARGSITYPWKYLSPGTRNRFELPMLADLKAKAEAEAKAAAVKAAKAKKAAEAKAAREKKAAEAKAAKSQKPAAAGATNAPAAGATNAPAAGATNAPAAQK